MKNELENVLYVEKFRPSTLDELICVSKDEIKNFLKNPLKMPSFLLYSWLAALRINPKRRLLSRR